MNNTEKIIDRLCSDEKIEIPDINKLENIRDEELARDNPDFELIDEITRTILEIKNIPENKIDIESEINILKRKNIKHNRKIRVSKFMPVAVAITALITVNIFASPFIADGVRNFFPSIYLTNDGTMLDFRVSNEIPERNDKDNYIKSTEPNLNQIKEFAMSQGYDIYIPTEMPEMDGLKNVSYNNSSYSGISIDYSFEHHSDDEKFTINISYDLIDERNCEKKIVNLSKDSVLDSGFLTNGIDTYVFFSRSAALFPSNQIIYNMYFYDKFSEHQGILTQVTTAGLEHDEAYKIFKSFK
ncbi:MAG: hypothetical protein K2J32_08420 [Ruminococcus sp.]|nr:hypothetical protein [Ruminococcus sp.]